MASITGLSASKSSGASLMTTTTYGPQSLKMTPQSQVARSSVVGYQPALSQTSHSPRSSSPQAEVVV